MHSLTRRAQRPPAPQRNMLLHKLVRVCGGFCASLRCVITHEPPDYLRRVNFFFGRSSPELFHGLSPSFLPEHLRVLVWNLHVSELRNIKGFGGVGGEQTIVMRTRVVAIHRNGTQHLG